MGYTRDGYATRTCGNKTLQIPVPVSWVRVELGYGYRYGVRYPRVYPCHCLGAGFDAAEMRLDPV